MVVQLGPSASFHPAVYPHAFHILLLFLQAPLHLHLAKVPNSEPEEGTPGLPVGHKAWAKFAVFWAVRGWGGSRACVCVCGSKPFVCVVLAPKIHELLEFQKVIPVKKHIWANSNKLPNKMWPSSQVSS